MNVLIIGANRGIGLGFVKKLLLSSTYNHIYATYRQKDGAVELMNLEIQHPGRAIALQMDVTDEEEISEAVSRIREQIDHLHLVINCVGFLHDDQQQPEKSLRHINSENLLRYFQINSIGSVLLAKHLLPLFKHQSRSIFASISAKVGSIGDNGLGGWYGYRASKAALNMFMRNVAIEYGRTSRNTIVVMLHPGTTDTGLSEPFQRNVPPEKLFSVERTVSQLLAVIDNLEPADSGEFFSWDGSRLPW
ncbi:MAG: SDR family NAD(P)-dependent oxidoreductase [Cyanobacteria bacterium P01_A01_bin.45]